MIGIALKIISTIELDIYQFPVEPEVELKWLLSLIPDSIHIETKFFNYIRLGSGTGSWSADLWWA